MSQSCPLGHEVPEGRFLCPTCGTGVPLAPAAEPVADTPMAEAVTPATEVLVDLNQRIEQAAPPPPPPPGWYEREGGQSYWTGAAWVTPPAAGSTPLPNGDPEPSRTMKRTLSKVALMQRLRGRGGVLAVVGLIVLGVVGFVLVKGGGGAPTDEALADAVDAMNDKGVSVSVGFEEGYVLVEIPTQPDYYLGDTSLVDLVQEVNQATWMAVPGNYKGVCIEASNVAKTCTSAADLEDKYGKAGSGR